MLTLRALSQLKAEKVRRQEENKEEEEEEEEDVKKKKTTTTTSPSPKVFNKEPRINPELRRNISRGYESR